MLVGITWVLIDIGIIRSLRRPESYIETITLSMNIGTPIYMSPELLQNFADDLQKVNPWKTIVWSLGVIIYEPIYLERPYFCQKKFFGRTGGLTL